MHVGHGCSAAWVVTSRTGIGARRWRASGDMADARERERDPIGGGGGGSYGLPADHTERRATVRATTRPRTPGLCGGWRRCGLCVEYSPLATGSAKGKGAGAASRDGSGGAECRVQTRTCPDAASMHAQARSVNAHSMNPCIIMIVYSTTTTQAREAHAPLSSALVGTSYSENFR